MKKITRTLYHNVSEFVNILKKKVNLDEKNISLSIITVIKICTFNILNKLMFLSYLIAVKNIVRYN